MYVKRLELSNFQVFEKFACNFEGNVYFLTGDNELGKSTLLKAIGVMLTGSRDSVLKNGTDKGFSKMIVGDDKENYEVELRFTKANPRGTLSIKSPDGMKSENVSVLQKIFGYTDFDAVEFSRWSETAEGRRKQVEVVKNLLPKDAQTRILSIDDEVSKLMDKRKDLNVSLKSTILLFNNIANDVLYANIGDESNFDNYKEEKDLKSLMEDQQRQFQLIEKEKTVSNTLKERVSQLEAIPGEIQAINDTYKNEVLELNKSDDEAKTEYDRIVKEALDKYNALLKKNAEKEIELKASKETKLSEIEAKKADIETKKANCVSWLAKYEENKPTTDLNKIIEDGDAYNKKCKLVAEYKLRKEKKTQEESEFAKADDKITSLLKERETLIKDSKLPIAGLSFTDDGLEMSGVPFIPGKVSDSQIMEVAVKLIIASNPKVKVFRIARGESLGKNRLKDIVDIAKKNGFQGFIEEVKRGQDEIIIDEYTEA